MRGGDEEGPGEPPVAGALWPDIAVRVEVGGLAPRWRASSVHPELGWVSGRGLSREAAIRSLVRGMRRSRFRPPSQPHAGAPLTEPERDPEPLPP